MTYRNNVRSSNICEKKNRKKIRKEEYTPKKTHYAAMRIDVSQVLMSMEMNHSRLLKVRHKMIFYSHKKTKLKLFINKSFIDIFNLVGIFVRRVSNKFRIERTKCTIAIKTK